MEATMASIYDTLLAEIEAQKAVVGTASEIIAVDTSELSFKTDQPPLIPAIEVKYDPSLCYFRLNSKIVSADMMKQLYVFLDHIFKE
jgi:hypothetical protein